MGLAWFICPYDTSLDVTGRVERYCAAGRYIPVYPDKNGSIWTNVQFKNSYNIVKVSAPQTVLDKMAADPDFYDITKTYDARTAAFLKTLGFTDEQVTVKSNNPEPDKNTVTYNLITANSLSSLDVAVQDVAAKTEK